MREIDKNALKAKEDDAYIEKFMKEYEVFILHTAHKASGRYITKRDDQWSIALSAFHEAIKGYDYDKGGFFSFAETVIRRRIYDYIRKQSKHFCEVSIDSYSLEGDKEEGDTSIKQEVMTKMITSHNNDAQLEIEVVSHILREYGFSFFDLISASPKAMKTKTICAKSIVYLSQSSLLLNEMRRTKNLPLKIIEKNLSVPRKILERHRKYIIAGVEIVSGDYPILSEYFKYVREEMSK